MTHFPIHQPSTYRIHTTRYPAESIAMAVGICRQAEGVFDHRCVRVDHSELTVCC